MLRPRVYIDAVRQRRTMLLLRAWRRRGARAVMFTVYDPVAGGIYTGLSVVGMAIFNQWVREIAYCHGVTVVDMWRMRDVDIAAAMDTDRMHLNSFGHTHIARAVLDAIGVNAAIPPVELARRRSLAAARAGPPTPSGPRVPRALGAPPHHRPLLGRHRLGQAIRGPPG